MSDDQSERTEDVDPTVQTLREVGSEMGLSSLAAHLYRGEMERVVLWRERLDRTTNFAVTVMGAVIAYAFTGQGVGHTAILAGMIIGVTFLFIEARRLRRYDIWRSRARTMQENLFANALDPSAGVEQRDWREQLSKDYREPTQKMTFQAAVAHRLRRVYLPLLVGLFVVWVFHLLVYGDTNGVIANASIQNVSGITVVSSVVVCYALLVVAAFRPNIKAETGSVDHGDLEEWR